MRIRKAINAAFLALFAITASVVISAVTPVSFVSEARAAVINSIDVRGNARIEDEVVISFLTVQPGDNVSNFDIDESVKALFGTGLFSDVSIFIQSRVLIVDVDENSTVNKVFFEGNSRLKDDVLVGVVRLKPQGVYSDQQASEDVSRIEEAYARVGRRDATVSFEAVPLANNRINVIYRVNEGDKTKIARITFVGNDTFSEQRLRDIISTRQSTFLSAFQTNDIYDPNRINSDEEALRRFYFNKGFADFQIISTDAVLDEAENQYYVTFTLEEGPRYTFGNVLIDSTISGVDGANLQGLIESKSGDYYSAKSVEDTVLAITERVSEEGFAFVEVIPRGNRNFADNTIDVTYLVDEGARLFIEDIRIVGNDRTRDYVIRREFDVSEGDAYNQALIQKTRKRLEALRFFERVSINTRPGSSPDKVVVVVSVVEQSTGDLSLSGGFSTNGGASAQVSLTERNFLGRGQFFRVNLQAGEDETSYGVQFREPFFLGYRISAGVNFQVTESDETSERQYIIDSTQGTLTFGIPITEELRSTVFYSFNGSSASANANLIDVPPGTGGNADGIQGNADNELSAALARGLGDFVASGFGYSLVYNTLDNQQSPREGIRASVAQTFYGAGGDAEYFTTEAQLAGYLTLSEEQDVVLFGRVRGGHQEVYGADNGLVTGGFRVIDNFQARSNTIRGFDSFGYGPRDPLTGDALGGRTFWNATAEMQFPLPFIPRTLGLRGAFFADAGQLFDPGPAGSVDAQIAIANGGALTAAQIAQINSDSVRASVGASVLWASPFGPLRVDYAFPIASEEFDDIQEFSFGVSTAF